MKKSYDQLVKSVKFYRVILIAVVIGFGTIELTTILTQEEKIEELEMKEKTVHLLIEEVKRQKDERIMELQSANEVLIKVCNPSSFRDVAKRTPPPKLIKGCK